MIHKFIVLGKFYLFDVESASFFEIDELIYDTIESIKDIKGIFERCSALSVSDAAAAVKKHGEENIRAAIDELNELINMGLIFAEPTREKPVKSSGIKSLCLHICHDCNLSCEYCFAAKGTYHGEREYMSLEVGKAAVDFLIRESMGRQNLEIDFFGGEPLMNLEVIKGIVPYAREKEAGLGKVFKFTLTTNGILLDDDAIHFLNREMENVVLSLDGRKSVHDTARRTINNKDSYGLIVDKFKKFREQRGDKSYYIRGTYTAWNLDFSKDVEHIADLGFDQISIEPVVLPPHDLAISEEHIPLLGAEYERLAEMYLKRRKEGNAFGFFHFNVDLDGGPCLKRRITGCGAGSEYLAVSPKGELYPCHQFTGDSKYLLGDIFNGISNRSLSDEFKETTIYSKSDCMECWARYLCSGGCFANSINLGGGINKPYKIGCALMKKRLECALHIKNAITNEAL